MMLDNIFSYQLTLFHFEIKGLPIFRLKNDATNIQKIEDATVNSKIDTEMDFF